MWAVRESLMSLKRKEIDSSQETDESSVKSQIRLKKGFTKKTICLAFSRRFSFSSGLVFFLWRENNKNGNISLRQIDMTLRDKKIWTKQN